MTDYKQLCAEFVSAVDGLLSQGESPANPGQRLILTVHVEDLGALADRARAALAEPEPSVDDVLLLAAIIREVDGTNRSSASRLAEDILSHPASRWGK